MVVVSHGRTASSSGRYRNPAQVFRAAEDRPVIITRRNGEPQTLIRSIAVEHEHEALDLAASLVAASLATGNESFAERLVVAFAWMGFLPTDQREQFASEIVEVSRACASISNFDRPFVVLAELKATSEAIALGYTPDAELDWLDVSEPVNDPLADG